MPDKQRAARVLLEIIRQSQGDKIVGKTRLVKAFHLAHLYYAHGSVDYLTDWPIVKMPHGPGIDDFDLVISELANAGAVTVEHIRVGPYPAEAYQATAKTYLNEALSGDEVTAIRDAAEFIADKSGAQLSDITHEYSRTWNNADLGQEMPIYLDLLSESDYESAIEKSKALEDQISGVWEE